MPHGRSSPPMRLARSAIQPGRSRSEGILNSRTSDIGDNRRSIGLFPDSPPSTKTRSVVGGMEPSCSTRPDHSPRGFPRAAPPGCPEPLRGLARSNLVSRSLTTTRRRSVINGMVNAAAATESGVRPSARRESWFTSRRSSGPELAVNSASASSTPTRVVSVQQLDQRFGTLAEYALDWARTGPQLLHYAEGRTECPFSST